MKNRHKKILPPKKTLEADRELDARCRVNHESSTAESGGREMKADREFDARVAEEVMGWTRNQWKGMLEKTDYCILCGITCRVGSPPDPEFDFCTTNPSFVAPRYSTLIADAKQVLHKMIDKGYAVEITHDCVAWSVGFTHLDSGRPYFADWKDSLETQICLAALKAVEDG